MTATLAHVIAITSGFALLGAHLTATTTLATALIVDLSLAPVTAIVAYHHKRGSWRWAAAGLLFGAWTLAALLILVRMRRELSNDDFPIGPEAA